MLYMYYLVQTKMIECVLQQVSARQQIHDTEGEIHRQVVEQKIRKKTNNWRIGTIENRFSPFPWILVAVVTFIKKSELSLFSLYFSFFFLVDFVPRILCSSYYPIRFCFGVYILLSWHCSFMKSSTVVVIKQTLFQH